MHLFGQWFRKCGQQLPLLHTRPMKCFEMIGQVIVAWMSRLRDVRVACDMTQQEVADVVGVDIRTVQYWEQGTRHPGPPSTISTGEIIQGHARRSGVEKPPVSGCATLAYEGNTLLYVCLCCQSQV